jgi:carbonic anhydrase
MARLKQGNQRFVNATPALLERLSEQRREEVATQQQPFAAILGCADSRVPVEEVFDQGVGDLFVVRVAGNFAGESQVGSLEYAAELLSVPLIVVLGHTRCGAIGACLDAVRERVQAPSARIEQIVAQLQPAVRSMLDESLSEPDSLAQDSLLEAAAVANVRANVERLSSDSELLAKRIEQGKVQVVGAMYDLVSGVVKWLE